MKCLLIGAQTARCEGLHLVLQLLGGFETLPAGLVERSDDSLSSLPVLVAFTRVRAVYVVSARAAGVELLVIIFLIQLFHVRVRFVEASLTVAAR